MPPFLSPYLRLNQSFPVADNPWQTFRLAPTDLQFAIHGLPLDGMPDDDALIASSLSTSIDNAKGFIIKGARYLNPDHQSRSVRKRACSVVVQVAAEHGWWMTDPPSPCSSAKIVLANAPTLPPL